MRHSSIPKKRHQPKNKCLSSPLGLREALRPLKTPRSPYFPYVKIYAVSAGGLTAPAGFCDHQKEAPL